MQAAHIVLVSTACLALAGCTAAPPPEPAASLTTSKVCAFHNSGFAYAGGSPPQPDIITMDNDGGWCGHLNVSVHGSLVFGEQMHVVHQPLHGQVAIAVESHGTRVLYRPNPDFTGDDSFSVRDATFNITLPYNVVVVR